MPAKPTSPHRWPPPTLSRALALVATLAVAAPATAQTVRNDGVDVQQFRPGPGASDYLDILGGFTGKHLRVEAGLWFNHADVPLLTDRDGVGDKVSLLDTQGVLDITGALSLWKRIEIGVAVPLILYQDIGPGFDTSRGLSEPSSGVGIGDIRVTPKVELLGLGRSFAVAIAAPMGLPTGSNFGGYGAFQIEPTLIVDFVPTGYFRMTLNTAGRFRAKQQFDDLELGREVTWGVGMKFSFLIDDQPFSILGTFSGAFELPNQESEEPPFEFHAGLEWTGIPNISIQAALGAGLTRGAGAPDLRGVIGVKYTSYTDCPHGPEDYDGFEDHDDCADLDNDLDGLLDVHDWCPNERETVNGFDDHDGCPDVVPDLAVRLADASKPGQYDSPTLDSDGDGVVDLMDACPDAKEDHDGFLDEDGCPDLDNDGDGVLDTVDNCPTMAEIVNGFEDDDGCPDDGLAAVDDLTRTITITDRVYFATGKAIIRDKSFPLLDQIAALMAGRPDITKLQVGGHTDDVGRADFNRALSQRRSDAVRKYMIDKGIAPDRLTAKGFGEDEPIADNRTKAGRAENRRVEFLIIEYAGEAVVPVEPGDGAIP